jgi:hypothetical protein
MFAAYSEIFGAHQRHLEPEPKFLAPTREEGPSPPGLDR